MITNDKMERNLRIVLALLVYAALYFGLMTAGVEQVTYWMPAGTLVVLAALAWHWQRRADREWRAVGDDDTRELAVIWSGSMLAAHEGLTEAGLDLPTIDRDEAAGLFSHAEETLVDVERRHEVAAVLERWDAELAELRMSWKPVPSC